MKTTTKNILKIFVAGNNGVGTQVHYSIYDVCIISSEKNTKSKEIEELYYEIVSNKTGKITEYLSKIFPGKIGAEYEYSDLSYNPVEGELKFEVSFLVKDEFGHGGINIFYAELSYTGICHDILYHLSEMKGDLKKYKGYDDKKSEVAIKFKNFRE